jgi:NhaA family Na+:H+ antiporter
MALVAGIGFTMSLFIGGLAFADPLRLEAVKIAVLAASILSALAGATVLTLAGRRR